MPSIQPDISIIIPTYNPGPLLQQALNSVWQQSFINREVLVIDGGSTDGTAAFLKANQAQIDYWVSEPDSGIYDAMNKGVEKARGKWIYFLGSDDQLMPDVLTTIAAELQSTDRIVFGDVLFENGYRMKSFLGSRTWLQNTLHHQSAFYHRSLFSTFRYDTSLKIIADFELNLKVYAEQLPVRYIPVIIAACLTGGASGNLSLSLRETNTVRSRYLSGWWKKRGLSAFLWLYYAQKQLRFYMYGHRI